MGQRKMGHAKMGQGKNNSQGFTLIAALLILVLLSGVAAGLLFMVDNETRMGGNDMEANLAYYGPSPAWKNLRSTSPRCTASL